MRNTILATSIGLMLLPFAASAVTVDELRTQIADLLARIEQLQSQIGTGTTGTGVGTTVTGGTVAPAGSCPRVSRVLQKGDSGADVTRLQQFLALDPSVYPEALVTGYYGDLTVAAVKRFQCKNKIVCDGDAASTGYGVTGPRTAAILALQCPDGDAGGTGTGTGSSPVSGFVRVTPTSGVSPLNVNLEATVNTIHSCAAQTYEIHYGDGSAPAYVNVPANFCNELQQTFSHQYTSGGIYQVLLRSGTHQVSATVNVTQGANTTPTQPDSISASPTSGNAPLTVNFTGRVNESNQCNAGPYSINFGDGQTANVAVNSCVTSTFQIPHTYGSSGTYSARLYRGSPAVNIASVAITVGEGGSSGTGGAFSMTGGVDGNPLKVRATFDLASTCSRYDINWGDNSTHSTQSEGSCGSGVVSKDVTHTYSSAGTYTITLKRGAQLEFIDTAVATIVQ